MKRILSALTAGVLLLVPGVIVSTATATVPGRNGQVTFMRQDAAGFWQVWAARADLTGARQLTHGRANSGWPVWSPVGQKIAFDSDRSDPNPNDDVVINDVFTMNSDGSSIVNLTGSHGFSADAGWSPDGSSITFESDRGTYPQKQGVYVMRRDGTHVRRVTTVPANATNDVAARFSPDGNRLVFTRFRGNREFGNSALFTVDVSGHHLRRITSFAIGAGDADWSPEGSSIVCEAFPDASSHGDIYTVRPDATHLRNLTHNPTTDGAADPVWAPDGTKILFLRAIGHGGNLSIGLATMRPNGSARHFISSAPIESHQPDWQSIPCSPDHQGFPIDLRSTSHDDLRDSGYRAVTPK